MQALLRKSSAFLFLKQHVKIQFKAPFVGPEEGPELGIAGVCVDSERIEVVGKVEAFGCQPQGVF